jgi:hypothetical protein
MRYLKSINENKNKLTTDNVWVIYPNNGYIDELFLDIKSAQTECDIRNKEYSNYTKQNETIYSVIKLNKAIEILEQDIKDNFNSYDNPDY